MRRQGGGGEEGRGRGSVVSFQEVGGLQKGEGGAEEAWLIREHAGGQKA